jgi:hypothetical protein
VTKPSFSQNISLGNVIQIVAMIVTVAIGWQQMSGLAGSNAAEIEKISKAMDDAEAKAATDIRDHETRLRRLEDSAARSDERMANILNLLARIDGRLERIERAN